MLAKQSCRCQKCNAIKKLRPDAYSGMHDFLEKEGKSVDLQNDIFMCNNSRTHLARTQQKQTTTADIENCNEDVVVDNSGDDTLTVQNVFFAESCMIDALFVEKM